MIANHGCSRPVCVHLTPNWLVLPNVDHRFSWSGPVRRGQNQKIYFGISFFFLSDSQGGALESRCSVGLSTSAEVYALNWGNPSCPRTAGIREVYATVRLRRCRSRLGRPLTECACLLKGFLKSPGVTSRVQRSSVGDPRAAPRVSPGR